MLFLSFVAGLIFGVGSGYFEKLIGSPLRGKLSLSDSELSILSFGGLMLVASIIVSAMGGDSSAFWLVLGGMLGAFAIRAFVFGKAKADERKSLKEAAADAQEQVEDVVESAAEYAEDTVKEATG